MDLRHLRDRLRSLAVTAARHIRNRPHHSAAAGLIAALVAVVLWSCQSTPRSGDAVGLPREPDVRIRIRQGVAQIKLSGPDEFVLQPDTGKPATMTGPITAAATPGGCRVTDARGTTREFPGAASIEVLGVGGESADPKLATRIRVDGVTYPGHIRLVPRGDTTRASRPFRSPLPEGGAGEGAALAGRAPQSPPAPRTPSGAADVILVSGAPRQSREAQPAKPAKPAPAAKLDAIEILPIETYLAGVVGSELYKDWPLTAFEVQAVCARTYALHERARAQKLGRDFDLESTTYDQAYNGGPPLPVALQAVEATRGVVLTWEGHLLRAYYSSTCGGRTASARDVWPTGPGYEFNLDAPIQAEHRESACQISPRYRWDAVRERAELSRRIREWGKANGNPVARLALLVSVQTAQTNADDRPTTYSLLDDKRATYTLPAEMLRQACNFTVPNLPELTRETKVYSSDMAFEGLGTKITIHGRGFGHGVGMCQYCTKAFADRGRHWRDIVLGFYPGAKLERAY